jgi:hypothetical protein
LRCANLCDTSLIGANFHEAILARAYLCRADLSSANFCRTDLYKTDLSGAKLIRANLQGSQLAKTNFTGARVIECQLYGLAAWDLILDGIEQKDLIITSQYTSEDGQEHETKLIVDDLQVAQFIHLLLNNRNLRRVIDTIGQKGVLILGRFTEERKVVLEAIRDELRRRGYVPMLFDFEKPAERFHENHLDIGGHEFVHHRGHLESAERAVGVAGNHAELHGSFRAHHRRKRGAIHDVQRLENQIR